MSASEDIELIHRGYDAWNRGDIDGLLEIVSPEIDVYPVLGDVVSADNFHGHEGMRHWYETINDALEGFRSEIEDVVVAGEGRYLALLRFAGRGKASGAEVTLEAAHLLTIRDGLLVRLEGYQDRAEAFKGAGWAKKVERG